MAARRNLAKVGSQQGILPATLSLEGKGSDNEGRDRRPAAGVDRHKEKAKLMKGNPGCQRGGQGIKGLKKKGPGAPSLNRGEETFQRLVQGGNRNLQVETAAPGRRRKGGLRFWWEERAQRKGEGREKVIAGGESDSCINFHENKRSLSR